MSAEAEVGRPVPCAGVVCLRGGQVLLIRRGKAPLKGEWSLPGGRMELVFWTLGLARHLVVGCIMLALALAWETLKWAGRGGRALVSRG